MVIMKSLLQHLLLSLFVIVLGVSSLYCFSSITLIALGMPSPSSSTTADTTNATLNEVPVLNSKGVSLNGLGKLMNLLPTLTRF